MSVLSSLFLKATLLSLTKTSATDLSNRELWVGLQWRGCHVWEEWAVIFLLLCGQSHPIHQVNRTDRHSQASHLGLYLSASQTDSLETGGSSYQSIWRVMNCKCLPEQPAESICCQDAHNRGKRLTVILLARLYQGPAIFPTEQEYHISDSFMLETISGSVASSELSPNLFHLRIELPACEFRYWHP